MSACYSLKNPISTERDAATFRPCWNSPFTFTGALLPPPSSNQSRVAWLDRDVLAGRQFADGQRPVTPDSQL